MNNPLAFCQKQIRTLNSRLINSEIALDDYRKNVETLLGSMGWQMRVQFDSLIFS
jgi:hypothetical protein